MAPIKKTTKPAPAKVIAKSAPAKAAVAKLSHVPTQAMKPVVNSAAPAKPAAPAATPARTITQIERQRMIEESAYYRAERSNFTGDPDEHWSAAEKEIDARLAREHVRVA